MNRTLRNAAATVIFLAAACSPFSSERTDTIVTPTTTWVATTEPAPETFALGTALTPAGAVAFDAREETFNRGQEIFLSVDTTSSSAPLSVAVVWYGPDGRELRRDARTEVQRRFIPFRSGPTHGWANGAHTAVVVIDDRKVWESRFTVS